MQFSQKFSLIINIPTSAFGTLKLVGILGDLNPPRPSATPPQGGRKSTLLSVFSPPPGEMPRSGRGGLFTG
jgi:hypothetical protein